MAENRGKDFNFFQVVTATAGSFPLAADTDPDVQMRFRGPRRMMFRCTSGTNVEYSFNGNTVHGRISSGEKFDFGSRMEDKIWFSGTGVVDVYAYQCNGSVSPSNFGLYLLGPSGFEDGYESEWTPKQIARLLTQPTGTVKVTALGDSRTVPVSPTWMDIYCPAIKINGGRIGANILSSNGHTTYQSFPPAGNGTTSAPTGLSGIASEWTPITAHSIVMTGANENSAGTNITLMRALYATGMSEVRFPNLWQRMVAAECGATAWYTAYGQPTNATALPGFRTILRPNTATTSGEAGVIVGDTRFDWSDPGYTTSDVEIPPGYDWETHNALVVEFTAVSGAATVLGETVASEGGARFLADLPGVFWDNHAVGGRAIHGFLDPQVYSDLAWQRGAEGADVCAWMIGLGTNNPQGNNQEAHEGYLKDLIALGRAKRPGAPFILHTSFPASADVGIPYYVLAARQVAAEDPGVLLLDTYEEMPSYAEGDALGYYGDFVHYSDTGNQAWLAVWSDLLLAAAA